MAIAFAREMLVAGGGIGGLATALACHRAGWRARVFERSPVFSEVGAGLQLGPNATRVLQHWGLADALRQTAFFPEWIDIRRAHDDRSLARMPLGADIARRYGAPYATLHRADLHGLLLQAVRQMDETVLHPGSDAGPLQADADGVRLLVQRDGGRSVASEGEALVVADGLWSHLRRQVAPQDGAPVPTGHFAWRTLIDRATLDASTRAGCAGVSVWLGPRLHVVAYPVRRGELLNLVVLAEGRPGLAHAGPPQEWNADAPLTEVEEVLSGSGPLLRALAAAAPQWRRWMLHDRPPVTGPDALARGRVALLGDAAHPMLPYLAQGAAMALEDAAELQRTLAMDTDDVQASLARYALHRWQRVARVQARARRQSDIFHATGPLRWGRDAALSLLGRRLLDQPWLWAASR
ncbi:FAD-dependent oxidoreductase [Xylophilus sp. Kf1]|nr:FAD-dependent oxidoreductase [Xylophilus sp. Kf1]